MAVWSPTAVPVSLGVWTNGRLLTAVWSSLRIVLVHGILGLEGRRDEEDWVIEDSIIED